MTAETTHALYGTAGGARAACGTLRPPQVVVASIFDDAQWERVTCRNCHACRGADLEAAHR